MVIDLATYVLGGGNPHAPSKPLSPTSYAYHCCGTALNGCEHHLYLDPAAQASTYPSRNPEFPPENETPWGSTQHFFIRKSEDKQMSWATLDH